MGAARPAGEGAEHEQNRGTVRSESICLVPIPVSQGWGAGVASVKMTTLQG